LLILGDVNLGKISQFLLVLAEPHPIAPALPFLARKTISPPILPAPLLFWQICVIYSVLFGRYE